MPETHAGLFPYPKNEGTRIIFRKSLKLERIKLYAAKVEDAVDPLHQG
jgi:hypothetical protein